MMGARNALTAYSMYAGKVDHLPMVLLAYMATVSLDNDPAPWFGMGHAGLAEGALGRKPDPAALKAVQRAVRPLLELGAISIDRRPAPRRDAPSTVRYRLHLRMNGGRSASTDEGATVDGQRPNGGRSASSTVDGQRPPEEYEEDGGATTTEDEISTADQSRGGALRAREGNDDFEAHRQREMARLAEYNASQQGQHR